jgi:hypothetical protein
MTSGSGLEMVGLRLPRCSGLFWSLPGSLSLSLSVPRALHDSEVNGARVGSWRGRLARSLLRDDIFPHGAVRRTR